MDVHLVYCLISSCCSNDASELAVGLFHDSRRCTGRCERVGLKSFNRLGTSRLLFEDLLSAGKY